MKKILQIIVKHISIGAVAVEESQKLSIDNTGRELQRSESQVKESY